MLLTHLQAAEQMYRGCAGQCLRRRHAIPEDRCGEESQDEQDGGVDLVDLLDQVDLVGAAHVEYRDDADHHRDQQCKDGVDVPSEIPWPYPGPPRG